MIHNRMILNRMSRNTKQQAPYWRLVAMLPVILIGFITTIGTGDDGDDNNSETRFKAQEPFSYEVTVASQNQLNLRGVNGEITITGQSVADSVIIAGIKRVQSKLSDDDANTHLQALQVEWENLTTEVNVETNQPKDTAERNYVVDYTITLPNYFEIQVDSINGMVTLDSIVNNVAVTMANAEVILTNINGSALVSIANGTIESEIVLPLNGTIELSTVTGDIDLAIPANTSATFSATALFGSISVTNLVIQDEVKTATSLSGTLGGGQGMIALTAMGDISVAGF